MSHRIPYELLKTFPHKGLVILGQGNQSVTLHLIDVSFADFKAQQVRILNVMNRLFWFDALQNRLPIHILYDGRDYYPDIGMAGSKRLSVNSALLAVKQKELVDAFNR